MARPSPVIDSGIFGVSDTPGWARTAQAAMAPTAHGFWRLFWRIGSVSGTEEVEVERWTAEAHVAQSVLVRRGAHSRTRRTRREPEPPGRAEDAAIYNLHRL